MPTDRKPRTRSGGAADRLQQMYAEQITAADTAEKAWRDRTNALTAAEQASERFRDAVLTLADQGLSAEQIALLTNAPLGDVRSARRTPSTPRKRSGQEPVLSALAEANLRREAEASVALDRDETHVVATDDPTNEAEHAFTH